MKKARRISEGLRSATPFVPTLQAICRLTNRPHSVTGHGTRRLDGRAWSSSCACGRWGKKRQRGASHMFDLEGQMSTGLVRAGTDRTTHPDGVN